MSKKNVAIQFGSTNMKIYNFLSFYKMKFERKKLKCKTTISLFREKKIARMTN